MAEEVATFPFEVMVEGETHPWAEDTISVADIRVLGNLPADAPVIEQDLRATAPNERWLTMKFYVPVSLKKATSLPKSESTSGKVDPSVPGAPILVSACGRVMIELGLPVFVVSQPTISQGDHPA